MPVKRALREASFVKRAKGGTGREVLSFEFCVLSSELEADREGLDRRNMRDRRTPKFWIRSSENLDPSPARLLAFLVFSACQEHRTQNPELKTSSPS